MKVLITGGAGYIGSHITLVLLKAGYEVVVLDNLCNSSILSLKRVADIVGRSPVFINGDILDRSLLDKLLVKHSVQAVIHCAGLKSVNESIKQPLIYFKNNVSGTINLCQAMSAAGIFNIVFSSSATVYGEPLKIPIMEDHQVGKTTNPYGRSKFMVEQVLNDIATLDSRWKVALLRYFNPVGNHESGLIGEDPRGFPNNLFPYITMVMIGKLRELAIFGNDYQTVDGTGVRDYIHVMDLANGHLAAINSFTRFSGINVWNLGTGQGYSVLQIVEAFEKISGQKVPIRIAPRRLGDVAKSYANPSKAIKDLGWRANRDLLTMVRDSWHWQSLNPDGYKI